MVNEETERILGALPSFYRDIYAAAEREETERGVFFLEETYITSLHEELGVFPRILNKLLTDAAGLREDRDYARLALFIYRSMLDRKSFLENIDRFEPSGKHDFLLLFCLLPFIRGIQAELEARKVPSEVIADTLAQFEEIAFIFAERYDRLGYNMRYFKHMQLYVDGRILNIGRLRFERTELQEPVYFLEDLHTGQRQLVMGRAEINSDGLIYGTPPTEGDPIRTDFTEDDAAYHAHPILPDGRCSLTVSRYPKDTYRVLLQPGDSCLSVHIPGGSALTEGACEESYRRAGEIFERCFSEPEKAFVCYSWMMSPQLEDMLSDGSALLSFKRKYRIFPIRTEGADVLNFVFRLKYTSFEELPEDTSLQRAIKKLYLNGDRFYEFGGVYMKEIAPKKTHRRSDEADGMLV